MKRLLGFSQKQIWLVPLSFMALCGFTKIIDWGKQNFKQADRYEHSFIKSAQSYIRSVKVYDQFTTIATFDVMLLTDQMRMLFVDFHKKTCGLSREQDALLRQRQINENRYFISMYVVGSQKDHMYLDSKALFTGEYQKSTDMLKGTEAMWSVRMIVGGKQYQPESVRVVELPVEYRQCFGNHLSQFSTVYLVRFAAYDVNNNYIFSAKTPSSVVIRFASAEYHVDAVWKNIQYYIK